MNSNLKKEKQMLTINEKQEFLKTIIDLIKKYPMELSIERRPKEYSFDIKQVNDTDFIINMTRTSSFKNGLNGFSSLFGIPLRNFSEER